MRRQVRRFLTAVLCGLPVAYATAQFTSGQAALDPRARPNIVLIVADDLGVDMVSAYAEGAAPPCTPALDTLAAQGVLFRNAWSNPVCSPTRAQLLTGRHGFRTGIGAIVRARDDAIGLSLDVQTIPGVLAGYDSSAVGKWHLADPGQGLLHPLQFGFNYFAGPMYNLTRGVPGGDYFKWLKNVSGQTHIETAYATTVTARDAVARAAQMEEPWFLYVAFNAPHIPLHVPPEQLCQEGVCERHFCPPPADPSIPESTKAMVEALDTEIGDMLDQIYSIDPDVFVFFIGDNGTAPGATEPPFKAEHAKATLYEGGVNVPLIIAGPGVQPGESHALVSAVDLLATITDLTGSPARTEDSVSLTPYLRNPAAPSIRRMVYAEWFIPNFDASLAFQPAIHIRAVRNSRFKLIRSTGLDGSITDEFYDLVADPFEQVDLFPPRPGRELGNYRALLARLRALRVD